MTCQACGRPQRPAECSVVNCPHRKPGTSLWGPQPYERKHDGTGWDRFYRGQRRPPDKVSTDKEEE